MNLNKISFKNREKILSDLCELALWSFDSNFGLKERLKRWGGGKASRYIAQLTLGLTRWGVDATPPLPHKVFLEFFRDKLLSRFAVSSSCAHIAWTHFDTGLVRIACYGYEIWRHKQQVVKPFLKKNACFLPFVREKCKKCQQKAAKC